MTERDRPGVCTAKYAGDWSCALLCSRSQGMTTPEMAGAQAGVSAIPDLTGVWNGGGRARRINGPNAPWVPGENFPVLNERGLAFQSIFDEAIAPKYDCVPCGVPRDSVRPVLHGGRAVAGPGPATLREG